MCVCVCVCMHMLSHVWLFEALWTGRLGSSARGIFQARILEWCAIFSSRGSSQLRDLPRISYICIQILYHQRYLGFQVGFSSWIVIKNIPTFLSTICLSASKHFSSYLLMVKPRGAVWDWCFWPAFLSSSKPKSCFAGQKNVTLLSAADGQNCSIAQSSQLLIP